MKKLITLTLAIIMTLTLAMPAMACELETFRYSDEEDYSYEEFEGIDDFIEPEMPDWEYIQERAAVDEGYIELYTDPNYAAVANEWGEVSFYPTGEDYYDPQYDDSFVSDEEEMWEAFDSVHVTPDWEETIENEEFINLEIEEGMPEIEGGGDPTSQREWANEKIWEEIGE